MTTNLRLAREIATANAGGRDGFRALSRVAQLTAISDALDAVRTGESGGYAWGESVITVAA